MTNSLRKTVARINRAAVTLLLPFAAACGTNDNPSPFEPTGAIGRVRLVNLITDAPRSVVNASLEGVVFTVNLGNGASAPANLPAPSTATYSPVYTGNREFVLKRTADTTVTVATMAFSIGEEDRTLYAVGGAGGSPVEQFITTDTNTQLPATEVRLRLAHFSTNAGSVDVFVTAAGANLSTATPFASGLIRTATSYGTLAPGSYVVRTVPTGTAPANRASAVSLTSAVTVLPGGGGRTVIIADAANGGIPLRAIFLTDR